MVSPNGVSGSGVFKSHKAIGDENSKMEKPVMQTKDMLDIFEPLATKISTGLLNHIAHKKEEVQRNTDAAYTRMFGE